MDNRRIDRTQVDRTDPLAPGSVAGTGTVDSPEFARQVAAALHERKGTVGKAVLRELVSDFVRPIVSDPQILSSDRAIAILEQLLTTVLPQLKESEEFNHLAKTVLGEEIEQRRQLRARGLEDTAT
jgi:hypothetical protein